MSETDLGPYIEAIRDYVDEVRCYWDVASDPDYDWDLHRLDEFFNDPPPAHDPTTVMDLEEALRKAGRLLGVKLA